MKDHEKVINYLKEHTEELEIPEGLLPEQMKNYLKQQEAQKAAEKKKRNVQRYKSALTVAAGICLVAGMMFVKNHPWNPDIDSEPERSASEEFDADVVMNEVAEAGMPFPEITYEDIYNSMVKTWEEQKMRFEIMEDGTVMEDAAEEAPVAEYSAVTMGTEEKQANTASDKFGETNVQTAGVDEGDIIKNDGRYLYQKVWDTAEGNEKQSIQIIDTQDGLKEVSQIADFDNIREFYVWEDVLVTIESKYLDVASTGARKLNAYYDVLYSSNVFHEISFYNIENRSEPEKMKTFTLQGDYASSRISEGYFYGFSKYYANQGAGKEDYDAYVPMLDGVRLNAEDIYLPEDTKDTAYLVLVAIDLRNPTEFTDTTGIVAGSSLYYVSANNIYVANTKTPIAEQGRNSDLTELLRFSYENGKFALCAAGTIKGNLNDSFSLDEYDNYLRAVSTVREYEIVEVTDDRTGEVIGSYIDQECQTNALYVLNDQLEVVGKVEGLAEDEYIYSARFMGNTGYFVTFRQTDPLFAVDLTDPENPKILSELKVSGFSEYLHGYGEGRLFGLGMEADEETGIQKGMKLSMFDISDPSNVQEIEKLHLESYNYSEALYNHRALMISPGKNLIGFEAEGSNRGEYWRQYMIFTYENETFVEKLSISTQEEQNGYYQARGTFIGDVFYLLKSNGSVQSYDLSTGEKLESLEP